METAGNEKPLSTVEFVALMTARGFPLSELDNWNTGALIDWALEHDRINRRQRGEAVEDPYEQYQQLKAMEPDIDAMYAAGEIKESKYQSFKQTLRVCEAQLGE